MGLQLSTSQAPINATVENCTYVENQAASHGGGVYILFGAHSSHLVTVSNSRFIRNWAEVEAGGILVIFLGSGFMNSFSYINTSGCVFQQNAASNAAAVAIVHSELAGVLIFYS